MQTVEQKAPQRRMTLDAVTRGKVARPQRIVLYGTEGIGKSTFAADAPSPIFLPAEAGTEHLDVARFPLVESWRDVLEALDALRSEHSYRTLAIDTLDALEPHVWAHTCATKSNGGKRAEHVEDYGFGKGYEYALDTWRTLLDRLDGIVSRGMTVILIAHSQVSTFKSPDTEDFQRYELKLNRKASALVKEWADHTLFAVHETLVHKQNNRAKGISTGNRIIHTTKSAAWDAKNRGGLPPTLPLSWSAFADALHGESADVWRVRIEALLERADRELAERVTRAVKAAPDDAQKLARIHNHLSVTLNQKEGAQ